MLPEEGRVTPGRKEGAVNKRGHHLKKRREDEGYLDHKLNSEVLQAKKDNRSYDRKGRKHTSKCQEGFII